MGLPQRGGPDFSVAGFLLLAAFGTFLWKSIPLESARPDDDSQARQTHVESGKVAAKLWQDPFWPVFTHLRHDKIELIKDPSVPVCKLTELMDEADQETHIRVIATMLSRGMEAETVENRRRRRYAVISALGQSSYIPRTDNSLSYCLLVKPGTAPIEKRLFTVPFEWYIPDPLQPLQTNTNTHPPITEKILVLWIPEPYIAEAPFGRFRDLAAHIAPCPTQAQLPIIYILGPARSDTLRKLASRAINEKINEASFNEIPIRGLHIISPTATVVDQYLVPQGYTNTTDYQKLQRLYQEFSPDHCKKEHTPCITFQRTISSDDVIARLLVVEILSRSDWRIPTGHIALVSEWNTTFGRAQPRSFERAFCNKIENTNSCKKVFHYSYLRGIDGQIHGRSNKAENTQDTNSRSQERNQNKRDAARIHRPSGTGRFDYLRRLALEIQQQDAILRSTGEGRIAAIGVLGSDVYDKLLILRALRLQFPNLLFFTTDLDAQFLHPAEYRWSRNLLIASSFGLELKQTLQGSIPPFRNSYQTSIFFATLLAAKFDYPYRCQLISNDCTAFTQLLNTQPGLLFEVGRHSAVQLRLGKTDDKQDTSSFNPSAQQGTNLQILLVLILLAILLILVLHQLKPATGWLVIYLSLTLTALMGLGAIALNSGAHAEPLSFTEGISVWPTEFIRFGAFCLSIYFINTVFRDLKNNCNRISRDFFSRARNELNTSKTLREIWTSLKQDAFRPFNFPPWLRDCVLVYLAVAAGFPISRIMGISNPWVIPLYWALVLGLWFWRINYLKNFRSINAWAIKMRKQPFKTIDEYWDDYCLVGNARNRCYRSFTLFLLYMAFAVLIFQITGFPQTPCRGSSCIIDKLILIISVPSMLLLIFFVLDELRLGVYWIKGLTRQALTWQSARINTHGTSFELCTEAEKKWATVLLIAERTSEISRLIYYPFLVIIIMLLSRSSYFDNWGFPLGLAVVVIINIVLLVMAGIKLRQAAEAYRTEALEYLQKKLLDLTAIVTTTTTSQHLSVYPGKQDTVAQLQEIIRHISELHEGIFQPFRNQPLVRASLLLLGAIGLTVGEYLTLLN